MVQAYTYSSFGKIESQLDPNFIQPYTFTSREFDPETGLYFNRHRTYDWRTGRFHQEDPILHAGNPDVPYLLLALLSFPRMLHPYVYAQNKPTLLTDPSGLISRPVCNGEWKEIGTAGFVIEGLCACYWQCIQCGGGRGIVGVAPGRTIGGGSACVCRLVPGPEFDCQCRQTPRSGGPPVLPPLPPLPPGPPEFRQAPQ